MAHLYFSPGTLPREARLAAEILSHPVSLLLGRATIATLDRISDRCLPLLSADEARTLRLCAAAATFSEQVPREVEDPRLAIEFASLLEAAASG